MDIRSCGCSLRSRQEFQQPRWSMLISKRILGVSLVLFATVLATAAMAGEKHYSWQKAPGPISGSWSVTCDEMAGMSVEFSVDGSKATGRISNLGKAGVFGYSVGEEIIRLEANDFGDWVGQLHWRAVRSKDRWDSIRFVATSTQLNATMTTDNCYKNMPRAR